MPAKSIASNPTASLGSIAIMFIVVLMFNVCEGRGGIRSVASRSVLIIGGTDAEEGRFPYMCTIRDPGSRRLVCGGTLIDEKWIMTAAQCLDPDMQGSAGMSPLLYCNISERTDQDASKRFTTSRCYLHHLWDGSVHNENDIALCQLDQSATVAIPDISNVGDDFTTNNVFSSLGWGSTSSRRGLADVLQIGSNLTFVQRSNCTEVEELAGQIKESMICAGGGFANTCGGDGGGPLFIRDVPVNGDEEDPSLDLIVGITSFGLTSCEADAPGVYTRVSCYRAWIDCIMQGTEQDCSIHEPCE